MSIVKKIIIVIAVLVVGVALFFVGKSEDKSNIQEKPVVKKTVKKMIMKCGQGKCGASMMEEVEVEVK